MSYKIPFFDLWYDPIPMLNHFLLGMAWSAGVVATLLVVALIIYKGSGKRDEKERQNPLAEDKKTQTSNPQ